MRKILLTLLSIAVAWSLYGQTGSGTASQQTYNAALTNAGQFGAPRYTTALLPTCNSSNLGALAYDTTAALTKLCNGSSWANVGSGAGTGLTVGAAIAGGTANRVLFQDAGNLVGEDADFTFLTDTLTVTKATISQIITIPETTFAAPYGIIYKGASRFIHNFNYGNNGTVTTEGENTFVGINSGNLTMGSTATLTYQSSYNTATGLSSLQANTLGYSNTATGANSLFSNIGGYYNTATGVNSLFFNTDGYSNIAVGVNSLLSNTDGYSNIAVGITSGRYIANGVTANTSGNNSIFIGEATRANANSETNQVVIGASAIGHGSNTVTLGSAAVTTYVLGTSVNAAPTAKLLKSADGITGTDIAGANLTLAAGRGTGTGASSLIIQAPTPLATGTGAQSLVTIATFKDAGVAGVSAPQVLIPAGQLTVGTTTTAGTATCVTDNTMGGASATDNFLNCTGTMPTVLTAQANAINVQVTAAGSSAQRNQALNVEYFAGYTGNQPTVALRVQNYNGGTDATSLTGGNSGIESIVGNTTTGINLVGVRGYLGQALGSGSQGYGVIGYTGNLSHNAAATALVGVLGSMDYAGAPLLAAAGFFAVDLSGVPITNFTGSFALGAANGTVAIDILRLYDNTALVHARQDGGSTWDKIGTKALTLGGGAVNFVRVDIASNTYQGGVIIWSADATDAVEYQNRSGVLPFAIINKGGTETCTVGTPDAGTEAVAASAGTFTIAFTTDTSPVNGCNFAANGTSSLTESVMRINYHVRLYGNAATAVTGL